MMEQNRIRVGIVSCGGRGQYHVETLAGRPEATVVALSDPDARTIAATRARFPFVKDLPSFADYRDMLSEVPLDAVVVSSPHAYHFEQAADSLAAGLHVLLEKPFVPTVEQAQLLVSRADEAGKLLAVGYQRRLQAPYRYIRQAIEAGKIGDVQFVTVFLSQDWYNLTKGTWRQDPVLGCGGQLNDSGSHMLDILLWMVGRRPSQVQTQMDNLGHVVDINAALLVRFECGAIGSFTIVGHARDYTEELQVFGSKGSLHYSGGKVYERLFDSPHIAEVVRLGPSFSVAGNFVDAILGRQSLYSSGKTATDIVELTVAAIKSASTGQPVSL